MSNTTGAKATAQQQRPAIIAIVIGCLILAAVAAFVIVSWARADANASTTGNPGGDVPATASATPPPVAGCTESVKYYAYEAPAGSNNFGADQAETPVGQLFVLFRETSCSDPLFFATQKLFAEKGENFTSEEAQALAQQYVADHSLWQRDLDAFFANASMWRTANDPNAYRTLGMVVGADPSQMPTLVKSDQDVAVGQALFFTYAGVERELRVFCRFQPVAHDFPAIQPPKPPAPAPAPSTEQPPPPPSGCETDCGGTPECVTDCGPSECVTDCGPPPCEVDCGPPTCEVNCGGKHASETPQADRPIVPAPDNGYVDRGGVSHTTPYVAPAPTPAPGQAPAQGDSGPGAVNVTTAPSVSHTESVPEPTAVVTGTVAQE